MFIFVSDVHLEKPQSKRYGAFLYFLEQMIKDENIKEVFLVGDIFDLWLGDRKAFIKKHGAVLEKIEKLAKQKKVHYFEGNHDFQLGVFWKEIGVHTYANEAEFVLNGKKVLVSHGDLLDSEDKGYLRLRWFFRTGFSRLLIKILPQSLLIKIGAVLSTTEKKASPTRPERERFLKKWKVWTERLYLRRRYDVFICGHYHLKAQTLVCEGKAEAVNLGTWLDGDFEFFNFSLKKFSSL